MGGREGEEEEAGERAITEKGKKEGGDGGEKAETVVSRPGGENTRRQALGEGRSFVHRRSTYFFSDGETLLKYEMAPS